MAIRFLDEPTQAPTRTSRIRFLDEPSRLPPDVQKPSVNIPARRILGEAVSAIPPVAEAKALFGREPSPVLRAELEALNLLPPIAASKIILNVAGEAQKGVFDPRKLLKVAAESVPFSKAIDLLSRGENLESLTGPTEAIRPEISPVLRTARESLGVQLPKQFPKAIRAFSPLANIRPETLEDIASFTLGFAPLAGLETGVQRAGARGLQRLQTELAQRTAQRQGVERIQRQFVEQPRALPAPQGFEIIPPAEAQVRRIAQAPRQITQTLPIRKALPAPPGLRGEGFRTLGPEEAQVARLQALERELVAREGVKVAEAERLAEPAVRAVQRGIEQPTFPLRTVAERATQGLQLAPTLPPRPPILTGRPTTRAQRLTLGGERGAVRIGKPLSELSEEELQREISKLRKLVGLKGKVPVVPKVDVEKATIRKEKFKPEVRPAIEAIEETFDISGKTRGRLSIAQINQKARTGKLTVDELANLPEGTALPAEELQRARSLSQDAIETSNRLISKFLATPSDEIAMADAIASTKLAVDTLTSTRAAMAEAGRALRILREKALSGVRLPSNAKQILEGINKDEFTKFAVEFRDAIKAGELEVAKKLLRKQTKRSIWDQIVDFFSAMLLTSPQTDIANLSGNTLANVTAPIEKVAISGVDKIRAALTKTQRERFLGEAPREAFATIEGIKQGSIEFIDEMLGKTTELGKIAELRGGTLAKEGIDKISDFVFRRLGAEDVFFKAIKRKQSLSGQSYRIGRQEGLSGNELAARINELRQNPTKTMLEEANREALDATFQTELGKFGKGLNALRRFPATRIFIPFFRTIINLVKFPAKRSPFALTPGTRSLRQIRGQEGPGVQSEAIGRAVLGTIASIPIAVLASQGLITGSGPKEKKLRDLKRAQGWQPFSIKVGDQYIGYRRAEPLSTFVAVIASLSESFEGKEGEIDERTVLEKIQESRALEFVSDQTFWRGLREVVDAVRGRNPRFIENLLSGRLVPPGVAFVARLGDPTIRQAEGLLEALKARIPGVSKTVLPRLDVFGKPIVKEGGLLRRILPFPGTTFKKDKTIEAMLRLEVGIPRQGKQLRGIPLTPQQRFNITALGGQVAKRILDAVVDTPGFEKATDEQQKQVLEKIIRKAKKGAKETELLRIAQELIPNFKLRR